MSQGVFCNYFLVLSEDEHTQEKLSENDKAVNQDGHRFEFYNRLKNGKQRERD